MFISNSKTISFIFGMGLIWDIFIQSIFLLTSKLFKELHISYITNAWALNILYFNFLLQSMSYDITSNPKIPLCFFLSLLSNPTISSPSFFLHISISLLCWPLLEYQSSTTNIRFFYRLSRLFLISFISSSYSLTFNTISYPCYLFSLISNTISLTLYLTHTSIQGLLYFLVSLILLSHFLVQENPLIISVYGFIRDLGL